MLSARYIGLLIASILIIAGYTGYTILFSPTYASKYVKILEVCDKCTLSNNTIIVDLDATSDFTKLCRVEVSSAVAQIYVTNVAGMEFKICRVDTGECEVRKAPIGASLVVIGSDGVYDIYVKASSSGRYVFVVTAIGLR